MPGKRSSFGQIASFRRTYTDVDEICEDMVGWDLDWRQIETGSPQMHIQVVQSRCAAVQRLQFSHAVQQEGVTSSDLTTFGFPDDAETVRWAATRAPPQVPPAIMDFNSPDGYEALSRAGFRGTSISVSSAALSGIAEQMKFHPHRGLRSGAALSCVDNYQEYLELRGYLTTLWGRLAGSSESDVLAPEMAMLDSELPVLLLSALEGARKVSPEEPLPTHRNGLRKAVEYIRDSGFNNPSVPEICAASGLSWRSLGRAFNEYFEMGPKRYLLNFRLSGARRQLRLSRPGTRVIDVANDWGFWHMGDFAREYVKMFGEYPRESLRR